MRKITVYSCMTVLISILLLSAIPLNIYSDYDYVYAFALVDQVIEGDLVSIIVPGDSFNVRLSGISCPQQEELAANEIRQYAKSIIEDKNVVLVTDFNRDSLGNILGLIFTEDKRLVNAMLVSRGYARVNDDYPCPYSEDFITLQSFAQENRYGMWQYDIYLREALGCEISDEEPAYLISDITGFHLDRYPRAILRTDFGDIEMRFYSEYAPNHVQNFINLAESGFYDNTSFHFVQEDLIIQGGDPLSRFPDRSMHGRGDPGYFLEAEFNDIPHKRGIVSMARFNHPNSAGSQFFICLSDMPERDGNYTVFAEVISGIEVADRISWIPRDFNDNPTNPVRISVSVVNNPQD